MTKKGKLGLLFGLLAGSVFGLLFAPNRGKTTRRKLRDEIKKGGYGHKTGAEVLRDIGKDLKETSKDMYEDSELDEKVEELKIKADELKDKAKEKAEEMKDKAKSKISRSKKK